MPFIILVIMIVWLVSLVSKSKKKKKLLELQNIVCEDKYNRLMMTEKQLMTAAKQQAQNDLRIIRDCMALLEKTEKPDVFFSRMQLMEDRSQHLMSLEPYMSVNVSPTAAYNEFKNKQNMCIQLFIERYYAAVERKVDTLKTETAKKNQYHKFYDNLQEYFPKMDKTHIDYIVRLYKSAH